jgi:hypothetical protein
MESVSLDVAGHRRSPATMRAASAVGRRATRASTTQPTRFRILVGRENPRLQTAALDRIYDAARGWPTKRAILKLHRASPAILVRGADRRAAGARPAVARPVGNQWRLPPVADGRATAANALKR